MRGSRPVVALAASAGALAAPAVAAADARDVPVADGRADQCVVEVTGKERSGRFITGAPVCYPTLAEALAGAGLPVDSRDADLTFAEMERSGALAGAAERSGTIGIHWDGANRSGASITITGADCAGGHIDLSSNWINRISSTWNGCPTVGFYDGFNKTGAFELTSATAVNLGAMNNAANSVAYGQ